MRNASDSAHYLKKILNKKGGKTPKSISGSPPTHLHEMWIDSNEGKKPTQASNLNQGNILHKVDQLRRSSRAAKVKQVG